MSTTVLLWVEWLLPLSWKQLTIDIMSTLCWVWPGSKWIPPHQLNQESEIWSQKLQNIWVSENKPEESSRSYDESTIIYHHTGTLCLSNLNKSDSIYGEVSTRRGSLLNALSNYTLILVVVLIMLSVWSCQYIFWGTTLGKSSGILILKLFYCETSSCLISVPSCV